MDDDAEVLHRPAGVPADVLVAPDTSPEREAVLRDAVAAGSATAGHALGLLLAARGDLASAHDAWSWAARQGSAEAGYLVAGMAYARDGDEQAYLRAVERADDGGSLLAAFTAAALVEDPAAPGDGERWAHALARARERDAAGSADAAVLLAQVHQARGELAEAVQAWQRAERRGVPSASIFLAHALLAAGDATAAEAAARRGELAGHPAASVVLAGLLQQRREYRESHRALRTAVERAGAAGDWETVRAVTAVFDHVTLARLRRHPVAVVGLVVGLVLLGVLAGWPWVAASVATLLIGVLAAKPAMRGMPLFVQGSAPASVSLLGIAVSGQLTTVTPGPRSQPPVPRPATARDLRFWRSALLTLGTVTLALWPWAAGWWSGEVVQRAALGGAAVLLLLIALWHWPEDVPVPAPVDDGPSEAGVDLQISFSPLPFVTSHVALAVTHPALRPFVGAARGGSGDTVRLSRLARTAAATPLLTVAVTLAVLAAAPDQSDAVRALVTVVAVAVEVAVVLAGLAAAVRRAYRGVRTRRTTDVAIAVVYAGAVALVVSVAMWLGLDAQLVRVLRGSG